MKLTVYSKSMRVMTAAVLLFACLGTLILRRSDADLVAEYGIVLDSWPTNNSRAVQLETQLRSRSQTVLPLVFNDLAGKRSALSQTKDFIRGKLQSKATDELAQRAAKASLIVKALGTNASSQCPAMLRLLQESEDYWGFIGAAILYTGIDGVCGLTNLATRADTRGRMRAIVALSNAESQLCDTVDRDTLDRWKIIYINTALFRVLKLSDAESRYQAVFALEKINRRHPEFMITTLAAHCGVETNLSVLKLAVDVVCKLGGEANTLLRHYVEARLNDQNPDIREFVGKYLER